MIKRSSLLKIGSIVSLASILLVSPAMATAKSPEQAGARIGNDVGLRTGATSMNKQRSKAIGASQGLILLTAFTLGGAIGVVVADDDDEPSSPGT